MPTNLSVDEVLTILRQELERQATENFSKAYEHLFKFLKINCKNDLRDVSRYLEIAETLEGLSKNLTIKRICEMKAFMGEERTKKRLKNKQDRTSKIKTVLSHLSLDVFDDP